MLSSWETNWLACFILFWLVFLGFGFYLLIQGFNQVSHTFFFSHFLLVFFFFSRCWFYDFNFKGIVWDCNNITNTKFFSTVFFILSIKKYSGFSQVAFDSTSAFDNAKFF